MKQDMFEKLEKHMLVCMKDGAHDSMHIYRVLYHALEIAMGFKVDKDILIAACMLHDIGRDTQYKDPTSDHALVGAEMAYTYLKEINFPEGKAAIVRDSISTHRFRSNNPPVSIEAKILFDADKLDVTGTIGIARTIAYKGIVSEPLYSVDANGNVLDGSKGEASSFFKEYNYKLKNIYDKFFTEKAKLMAEKMRKASMDFYEAMYKEAKETHEIGVQLLNNSLEP